MREIPQRELRNDISRVLREVEAGERLRITVDGRPVADLVPLADDPEVRARRLQTLSVVQQTYQPLSIDEGVARVFAAIVAEARRLERRPRAMDAWIAATAVAHHLPVYSQDIDFQSIPQVEVVLV